MLKLKKNNSGAKRLIRPPSNTVFPVKLHFVHITLEVLAQDALYKTRKEEKYLIITYASYV